MMPYLRNDKKVFFRRLQQLPASETEQEKILRVYLEQNVMCNIQSDAAKQGCDDLINSEELDGLFLKLQYFNFEPQTLALVVPALLGIFEAAVMSLGDERLVEAQKITAELAVLTRSLGNQVNVGDQVLALFSGKEALLKEFQTRPVLMPFSELLKQILDWFKEKPLKISVRSSAREWGPEKASHRACRLTHRGRLYCRYDGKNAFVPKKVQKQQIIDFYMTESYWNYSICAKDIESRVYCWGADFSGRQDWKDLKEFEVWEGSEMDFDKISLFSKKQGFITRYKNHDGYTHKVFVVSNGSQSKYMFLRSERHSADRPNDVDVIQTFDNSRPERDTPIQLPFGAHDLTVFRGRLYFLTSDGALQSEGRYEKTPFDVSKVEFISEGISSLTAGNEVFCGLYGHQWGCNNFQAYNYAKDFAIHSVPQSEMFFHPKGILFVTKDYIGLNEGFRFNNYSMTERAMSVTLGKPFAGVNNYVFSQRPYACGIKNEKIFCAARGGVASRDLQEKDYEPPNFFQLFKHPTGFLQIGYYACVLEKNIATCVSFGEIHKSKKTEMRSLVTFMLNPILLSGTLLAQNDERICKMLGAKVSCVGFPLKEKNGTSEDYYANEDYQKPYFTEFSLPKDEKFVGRANRERLCIETDKAVRCYAADGTVLQTYWLAREKRSK